MDEGLQIVVEMNAFTWNSFKKELQDVTVEEVDWRPLPEANTINLILRHLRIDMPWHLVSLEQGGNDAQQGTPDGHHAADSVALDFERNLKELDESHTRFMAALRRTTLSDLQRQTSIAYQDSPPGEGALPDHFLGFHFAVHLATHWGQIRALRNLYRKARGEPARFFPDNPTFPT